MAIIWTPEYSMGVKEIDDQHLRFIGLMNETYAAFARAELKEKIGDLIDRLLAHGQEHFATEERYFDLFNYEHSVSHKAEHEKLLKKAGEFKERFQTEGVTIVGELIAFLEDWLVDHLMTQDRLYVKCFHDHGLK